MIKIALISTHDRNGDIHASRVGHVGDKKFQNDRLLWDLPAVKIPQSLATASAGPKPLNDPTGALLNSGSPKPQTKI